MANSHFFLLPHNIVSQHDAINQLYVRAEKVTHHWSSGLCCKIRSPVPFLNKGCLEVFSHDGYARIGRRSGVTAETRENIF